MAKVSPDPTFRLCNGIVFDDQQHSAGQVAARRDCAEEEPAAMHAAARNVHQKRLAGSVSVEKALRVVLPKNVT